MKSSVSLRAPTTRDAAAFLLAVKNSRSLHRKWVSPPATRKSYLEYVRRASSESQRSFFIFHRSTQRLVGVININNIIRGNFWSAFLGYYGFKDFVGEGLMRQAMQLVLDVAFKRLHLHRLEANIQPANKASIALVRSCGFRREGYSKRYLKIGARWRDHERWALLAEDFAQRERTRKPSQISRRATRSHC